MEPEYNHIMRKLCGYDWTIRTLSLNLMLSQRGSLPRAQRTQVFDMDKLPLELAFMIAADLDIISIGALRLASKITSKLVTPIFQQLLRNQKADFSKAGLQRLCKLACSPSLNTSVSTLTLTCLYYHDDLCNHNLHSYILQPHFIQNPQKPTQNAPCRCKVSRAWILEQRAEQKRFTGEDMFSMLSVSLKNFKNIRHINLEALVVCGVDLRQVPEDVPTLHWRKLWTNAIQSYRILLLSIARAGIHLDSLSIYEATKKCSIPTHEVFELSLYSALERDNFAALTAHLKSFSISLATTTLPLRPFQRTWCASEEIIDLNPYEPFDISRGHNLHTSDHRVDLLADMGGMARLLRMMPNLEFLHIHICTTVNGILYQDYYQSFLATLFSEDWHFPKLSHLLLRGFRTSEDDLYGVLSRHISQLRTLGLENITLSSGSWMPVFSLLSHEAKLLSKLRLSVLWSSESFGNRINLTPLYGTQDAIDIDTHSDTEEVDDGENTWYTRDLEGDEVRRFDGIYSPPMMGTLGNNKNTSWYAQHRVDYGPF